MKQRDEWKKAARYIDEDFSMTPDIMQGNIRRVFEIVLKTKYYQTIADDIKNNNGFGKILRTLFDKDLIDTGLKPKLFDLCNLSNCPHHGEIIDASTSRNLTREELVPLIKETFVLLEKV